MDPAEPEVSPAERRAQEEAALEARHRTPYYFADDLRRDTRELSRLVERAHIRRMIPDPRDAPSYSEVAAVLPRNIRCPCWLDPIEGPYWLDPIEGPYENARVLCLAGCDPASYLEHLRRSVCPEETAEAKPSRRTFLRLESLLVDVAVLRQRLSMETQAWLDGKLADLGRVREPPAEPWVSDQLKAYAALLGILAMFMLLSIAVCLSPV